MKQILSYIFKNIRMDIFSTRLSMSGQKRYILLGFDCDAFIYIRW